MNQNEILISTDRILKILQDSKSIDSFINHISSCHPLTENFIDKLKNRLNWDYLSSNHAISWTGNLIEKYKDKWNWKCLSSNIALPWSLNLIEQYKDKWDWFKISDNDSIPWSLDLIEIMPEYVYNVIEKYLSEQLIDEILEKM